MNAVEFFRSIGLLGVKSFLKNGNIRSPEMALELQRLVDSHELVEKLGGLVKAREVLNEVKARNHKYAQNFERPALEKAINDVESCGGERETN